MDRRREFVVLMSGAFIFGMHGNDKIGFGILVWKIAKRKERKEAVLSSTWISVKEHTT